MPQTPIQRHQTCSAVEGHQDILAVTGVESMTARQAIRPTEPAADDESVGDSRELHRNRSKLQTGNVEAARGDVLANWSKLQDCVRVELHCSHLDALYPMDGCPWCERRRQESLKAAEDEALPSAIGRAKRRGKHLKPGKQTRRLAAARCESGDAHEQSMQQSPRARVKRRTDSQGQQHSKAEPGTTTSTKRIKTEPAKRTAPAVKSEAATTVKVEMMSTGESESLHDRNLPTSVRRETPSLTDAAAAPGASRVSVSLQRLEAAWRLPRACEEEAAAAQCVSEERLNELRGLVQRALAGVASTSSRGGGAGGAGRLLLRTRLLAARRRLRLCGETAVALKLDAASSCRVRTQQPPINLEDLRLQCAQYRESYSCFHVCEHLCYFREFEPARQLRSLEDRVAAAGLPASRLDGLTARLALTQQHPYWCVIIHDAAGRVLGPSRQAWQLIQAGQAADCGGQSEARVSQPRWHFSLTDMCSPFGLIEELLATNPWQLLATCFLLNKTSRVAVDNILPEFLGRCPGPIELIEAVPEDILRLLEPLGLGRKRARMLRRFSLEYLDALKQSVRKPLSSESVRQLHGVGKYASDAYDMFVLHETSTVQPTDNYLRWYSAAVKSSRQGQPN
ncbi:unnamed protein product [Polarella glacialis]|uniref:DNA-(apurinic or apyrimidinic site) lyase n=1 Tax=Polarella glacialis TaxID=89957 RepID=A0A813H5B1_POLGL|nr:unnamed protein product [Polarella glacialis]